MIRVSPKLIDTMAAYYQNRAQCDIRKWDKQADLKQIDAEAKNCGAGFVACSGTFRLYWPGGIVTEHSEYDYWLARQKKETA